MRLKDKISEIVAVVYYSQRSNKYENSFRVRDVATDRIMELVEENDLLIQDANAYLSGGGCGAVSVQNAAKLYRGMK